MRADALWLQGAPAEASPAWLEEHMFEVMAVIEKLWTNAACPPVATRFLDRLSWLPPLLDGLDEGSRALHLIGV